jgi:hypothetical protein
MHGVRIAVIKLRYVAEVAAEASGKRTAVIVALKAAQDLLGRLHDLEVLLVRARETQAALCPPDLPVWRDLGSLGHTVEDDCRQLHARDMHDRTKLIAIANQLRAGTRQGHLVHRAAG